MTTINNNPTLSIHDVSAFGGVADASAFLTPDSLMLYCQSRMRNLDEQIQTQFAKQQQANQASSIISDLTQKVGNIRVKDGKANPDDIIAARTAYDDAIAKATEIGDNNVVNKLTEAKAAFEKKIHDSQDKTIVDKDGNDVLASVYLTTKYKKDGCTTMEEIVAKNPELQMSYKGDYKLDSTAIGQLTSDLSNVQKDLNSGSELGMIQLQSLMSQRQQAIQLTTNLVQAIGDSAKTVAGNVGK